MGTNVHVGEKGAADAVVLMEITWALEPQPWVQILLLDAYGCWASPLISLGPHFPSYIWIIVPTS